MKNQNKKFTYKGDNRRLHYFHTFESEDYGIGIYPVLYGFRVRIWRVGDFSGCICDICCGSKALIVNLIFMSLLNFLEKGGDPQEIPFQQRKPFPQEGEEFTVWMGKKAMELELNRPHGVSISPEKLLMFAYRSREWALEMKEELTENKSING